MTWRLWLWLLLGGSALAQQGNTVLIPFPGVPTGSCATIMVAVNQATGDFYNCFLGSWLKVTGSGGGGGSPGGLNAQVQFNNSTSFGGITNVTSDGTNLTKLTAGAGTFDFSASTLFKSRVTAGGTTTVNGDFVFDSTAKVWHFWQNGADRLGIVSTNLGGAGQAFLSNADGSGTFADPIVSQATASNLNAQVVGNVASAATDSGNPVKIGGVFNTTQPTVTNGQRVDAQSTNRGAAIVATGADTFHVTVDSAPTTAVTGTFFQATQPVSGTVTANQGGTWTVQPGNTANTTAWKVDGSAVTQPISAASLPLPSGASTSAKQPALGTAGSASADVITVQGIASMTKLLVTPDSVALPANQSVNEAQINGHTTAECGVNGCNAVGGNQADAATLSGNPITFAGKGSGNANIPVVCDHWTPFSLASTTALKIVTLASAKQVYICSINIVVAGANNVALIEGTKTTNDCDTSTAGMAGGTTAATGWNFAANGGLTQGNGLGVIMRTATVAHDVCLLASASTQVSGAISWTQF